ncbi:MAG: helix-turn-helix domain-containing protein [Proteobacteria bacterium]|nr:helix-turn-helix domain-containing protein [Pseudomonadota bacterium]
MTRARQAAGGRDSDLARLLGITPSAVSRWNGRVPVRRAIELEVLTGGRVTRYDIRPDHFGPAPARSTPPPSEPVRAAAAAASAPAAARGTA